MLKDLLFVALMVLIGGCGEDANPPRGGGSGNGGSEQSNQPCQTDESCATGDPCRIGACNAASATCLFTMFDGDEDGHAPQVCGGDDCDDTTGAIRPGLEERCDERDNDCNGQIDDGLDCEDSNEGCGPEHLNCIAHDRVCAGGQCVCEEEKTDCPDPEGGRQCLDTSSDVMNCGECFYACEERFDLSFPDEEQRFVCRDGQCACADGRTVCPMDRGANGGSAVCVDTASNQLHCGGCWNTCQEGQSCTNGECR